MTDGRDGARILVYSHDSFGLGHLRRCREIAHALVEAERDLSVLILSGSPIIGSFDFQSRVDFVRIPGVIKLRDGDYVSLKLPLDVEQTLALRSSIIKHTADIFDPDLLLVDKEPLGLRGEVEPTLELMRERGVPCVLGLRDVMDDPELLASEWARKNALPALDAYYDDIWVYGLPQICDPLDGLPVPGSVRKRVSYTGYLRRAISEHAPEVQLEKIDGPYILVTVGGGGDGEQIVDWVLRAYESNQRIPYPALIVMGPFMGSELQQDFQRRVNHLERVEAITFSAHLESLMERAVGVVAMGGYNTFCEVLSFDKRAIIVPRQEPRREQLMRAARAQELGLVRMLADDGRRDAQTMATALRNLAQQPRPSERVVPGLLDGRKSVVRLARHRIAQGRNRPPLAARLP
ncbi:Predicted glycosyl transferase [Tistlia consotensis]|uniref:Predicted glycosyl transferase n=1 Tax=Tistlia consotensis USBA 355 TaxID=560819 RepID=A0A1Y6BN71_9PROT|nr:glycosyltransferase [Tistlia consotensis]SMF09391.1 Predicted glycosyl transferase [Tistlia consotensis USBA 355]SNR34586.1 Predicted glycosyl transferase [Tistlia consotensis]